ncbi:MAG TPA: carboxypeptidase regulatory-like domain-containing protein [Blastocatellia bacterium]|jgi:protocatechuate 3,4-dioxygenase beta subunit|nr:carboxypeptidase regulatory-like domain-containing protein [Blastocatellia bacterium]
MPKRGLTFGVFVTIFWLCLDVSTQAQTIDTKTRTATISGRVVLKGEPARNALVYLQPRSSPLPANPDAYLRARTDESGHYHIAGVAAGAYLVFALAPGFISSDTPRLQGKTFNVSEGENIENVDFDLKQGGVITGRVTDSQGRPLADERVMLSRFDKSGRLQSDTFYGPNFDMFHTDDRGVYRIYGLPEGRYLVSVGARQSIGMVTSGGTFYPRTFHPDATNESEAKVIEVGEGSESSNIDITVLEARKARAVSGRVINAETGQPVAGVEITWSLVSADGKVTSAWGPNGDKSRTNGEFHLKGMAPGKYGIFPRGGGDNEFFGESVMCDLSEGDASGVEIKVRPGGSISGLVVIEGTNDRMALAKLPQLYLNISVRPDQSSLTRMDNPKINADGSFRISGLPPCSARIQYYQRPEARGLAMARVERNGAPVGDGIKVGAGEQVTGVQVVLTYATFTLRGEVKITGGALPAGQNLHAYVRRADQKTTLTDAAVDARGQFVIDGLTPGEYEVTVWPIWYEGADPIDPRIAKALSSAKERVIINSGDQRVTFVVDLGKKEGDR